eukprot:6180966-Alexandrium_andersonii.AAC.1
MAGARPTPQGRRGTGPHPRAPARPLGLPRGAPGSSQGRTPGCPPGPPDCSRACSTPTGDD